MAGPGRLPDKIPYWGSDTTSEKNPSLPIQSKLQKLTWKTNEYKVSFNVCFYTQGINTEWWTVWMGSHVPASTGKSTSLLLGVSLASELFKPQVSGIAWPYAMPHLGSDLKQLASCTSHIQRRGKKLTKIKSGVKSCYLLEELVLPAPNLPSGSTLVTSNQNLATPANLTWSIILHLPRASLLAGVWELIDCTHMLKWM